jgi:hypothetical protein
MCSEKRISSPFCNGPASSKSTPLAETLRVRAALSASLPVDSTTGSTRGKRTAQRTSCWELAGLGEADSDETLVFKAFIGCTPDLKKVLEPL